MAVAKRRPKNIAQYDDELDALEQANPDAIVDVESEPGAAVLTVKSKPKGKVPPRVVRPRRAPPVVDVAYEDDHEEMLSPRQLKAPPGADFDIVVYRPDRQDPVWTKVAGIEFRAGEPVKVAHSRTVEQLVTESRELVDGTITTKAMPKRVKVSHMLKTNHAFMVNGVQAPRPKQAGERLPNDAVGYVAFANKWIGRCESSGELEHRWTGEQTLREKCGVTDRELERIMPFLETTRERLAGSLEPAA